MLGPRPQAGFSLIELMIVVAIVAVLAAVAIPQYQDYVTRARWSGNLTQLEPVKLAIAECLQQNGGDATGCDSAAELGMAALPQPQHASAAMTLTAADASSLTATVLGTASAGNCRVDAVASLDDGQLRWTLGNVANAGNPACTRQQTGVGG